MFELANLTHGWSGLALAYTTVQAPMLIGLWQQRAQLRKMLLSPLIAAPLTLAATAGTAAAVPLMQGLGLAGEGLASLSLGVAVSAGLGYFSGLKLARGASPDSDHVRGTIIQEAQSISTSERSRGRRQGSEREVELQTDSAVTLAGVPLTAADETKHFKLIGTTGTGKSTAIRELLGSALARGDRAVIADPDGGYLQRFHDASRGDVILNPFDPRSVRWDLFSEITDACDIDQLARSLIPDHEGSDRSWRGYARTFFGSVTRQAHAAGITDIQELYRLLVTADTAELRTLLAGTPAQPFLEEHNGRMFDSIRSVTSSAVGALDYIAQQQAAPFCVRSWVAGTHEPTAAGRSLGDMPLDAKQAGTRDRGVLFIPYRAGQIAALRSTISAWMRLAIFEAMNQPEGDQRLWFVVDELDALGQIDGLKDALARLRKFGGRCVLGFQSIAQVSSTYGSGEAQTIVENCGNTLILRCSGSEHGGTSHFASRLIGQREVVRTTVSRSRRPTDWMSSTTRAEHYNIEPAVMDSEIEQLPDLQGYLKVASKAQWMRVKLPQHNLESVKRGDQRSGAASLVRGTAVTTPHAQAAAANRMRADAGAAWRLWRERQQTPTVPYNTERSVGGSDTTSEARQASMRANERE